MYAIFRRTLKPTSWRLFRYIDSDYTSAYKMMSKSSLAVEAASDATTILQISEELKK
ncbi:DUF4225 domain-containing protein [Pseudomonas sp. 20P_3.2_Bac5]|uniref:DUF4225 domain-containing protein n=1 Tax=unclassified Pseudomonas TaxID=196821 RepID=UPI0039659835